MNAFDDAETVQRRAERLSGLLAGTDAPARPMSFPVERVAHASRRSVVRWRIAAAIALLFAGAAGVRPVRAWIADTVHSAWLKVIGRSETPVAPPPAEPAPETMGTVSFTGTDPLLIRVATRQANGGLLTIQQYGERTVNAAITGERNAAELVVLPDGLRINNRGASTAGYVIRVPIGVSRIVVLVGQERPRVFDAPAGQHIVVDLGVRTGSGGALNR